MLKTKKQMKKLKLDIPDDWPRPWKELNQGSVSALGYTFVVWKSYKRPANFKIYGFSNGRYSRIWWGKKVVHFVVGFVKSTEVGFKK